MAATAIQLNNLPKWHYGQRNLVACEATVGFGCGLAISAGSTAATYGADHFNAGVNTLINGKQYNTYGAQLLSDLTGIDTNVAEIIYGLPQIGVANTLGKVSLNNSFDKINSANKLSNDLQVTSYPSVN
ncbi:hypothetical protein [Cricetibacter osteomyelitidis]|uniref:hypothetical protein n=1 Tax=Cricetibacter osteomyelitidis TaxID=1521931 RepID=UPI0010504962|nr:hypothetical protein [Cricetibacter osteomyelitidis]